MVMTPDTPSFDIPPFDSTLAGPDSTECGESKSWTEEEDTLILSVSPQSPLSPSMKTHPPQYLSHPPRPIRTAYPPGSLPPPNAIDELTSLILTSPAWPSHRSFSTTRSRIFDLARKTSAQVLGGPRKREIKEGINMNTGFICNGGRLGKLQRPKLTVLGSANTNRQQHSMDSLYGDSEPGAISEALRYIL